MTSESITNSDDYMMTTSNTFPSSDSNSDEVVTVLQDLMTPSFIINQYSTIDEGLELLSKIENKWNHSYIDCYNKCFICDDTQDNHKIEKLCRSIIFDYFFSYRFLLKRIYFYLIF